VTNGLPLPESERGSPLPDTMGEIGDSGGDISTSWSMFFMAMTFSSGSASENLEYGDVPAAPVFAGGRNDSGTAKCGRDLEDENEPTEPRRTGAGRLGNFSGAGAPKSERVGAKSIGTAPTPSLASSAALALSVLPDVVSVRVSGRAEAVCSIMRCSWVRTDEAISAIMDWEKGELARILCV